MTIGLEPDILLDPVTGDLPAFSRMVSGKSITGQRISCRLQTHVGDWPLDKDAGIDWVSLLGQKPSDIEGLAAILALEVLSVPGVIAVEDLTSTETSPGEVQITMTAVTEQNETVPVVVTPQGIDGNPSIYVGGVLAHAGTVTP